MLLVPSSKWTYSEHGLRVQDVAAEQPGRRRQRSMRLGRTRSTVTVMTRCKLRHTLICLCGHRSAVCMQRAARCSGCLSIQLCTRTYSSPTPSLILLVIPSLILCCNPSLDLVSRGILNFQAILTVGASSPTAPAHRSASLMKALPRASHHPIHLHPHPH